MPARFKSPVEFAFANNASVLYQGESCLFYNSSDQCFGEAEQMNLDPTNDTELSIRIYGADTEHFAPIPFTDPSTTDGIEFVSQQMAACMFSLNFDPNEGAVTLTVDKDVTETNLELFLQAIQNGAKITAGKPLETSLPITLVKPEPMP